MTKNEFMKYFNFISNDDAKRTIIGDSPNAISEMRSKASIVLSRIGQELALIKNEIDTQYLILSAHPDSKIGRAKVQAEHDVNQKREVTRRELQYLREAVKDFMNACAGRVAALVAEKE